MKGPCECGIEPPGFIGYGVSYYKSVGTHLQSMLVCNRQLTMTENRSEALPRSFGSFPRFSRGKNMKLRTSIEAGHYQCRLHISDFTLCEENYIDIRFPHVNHLFSHSCNKIPEFRLSISKIWDIYKICTKNIFYLNRMLLPLFKL